jgi:hypothetical protein
MPRRIDVLLGEIEKVRAQMLSRGLMSDPGRFDTQLMKIVDDLAFIVKGQFKEIDKMKKQLRKFEKSTKANSKKSGN